MSYCVNCGVKLSNNEKKCPLCGTEVYHPDQISSGTAEPPYPPYRPLTIQSVSKSSIVTLLALIFLLPVLLTIICDLSINAGITWSSYVIASVAFVAVCVILPIISKKPDPAFSLAIDACALLFLLLFIEKRAGGSWFTPFALPLTLYIAGGTILLVFLGHHRVVSAMKITAFSFLFCGVGTLLTELLLNYAFAVRSRPVWSYYPLTVFVIIGIGLLLIDCNKPLKERLARKFFL